MKLICADTELDGLLEEFGGSDWPGFARNTAEWAMYEEAVMERPTF